jgi:flagellar hook-associated protein 2
LRDGNGVLHAIPLTGGTADAVASAVNSADYGVRAVVLSTDQGKVVQFVSQRTGTANAFQITGMDAVANDAVTAADAQVTVGVVGTNSPGYSLTSSSNTFTTLWPGVTVTVGGLASNVTVNVSTDAKSIAAKVSALVDAANAGRSVIDAATAKGAPLAGRYEMFATRNALTDSVAQGLSGNATLMKYGLDVDKTGTISFDADAFATAYAADPVGTKAAVAGAFATRLATAATNATAPVTGTITQSLAESDQRSQNLSKQIDNWTTRLNRIQSDLQAKYSAMQSALARLQSQQTYLSSMLKNASSSSSGSNS